jgi:hypothetical protein
VTHVEGDNRYVNTHMKMISSSNSTKSLPRGDSKFSHNDKINNIGKMMLSNIVPASTANPNNYSNNTLPKPGTNSNRTTYRNTISEVVSKVPAVINIPKMNKLPDEVVHSNVHTPLLSKEPPKSNEKRAVSSQCGVSNNANTTATMVVVPTTMTTNHKTKVKNSMEKLLTEKQVPEKLPVLTTSTNCTNPILHFLPNDTSLDDEYLSECENCKSAHGSRYYLEEEVEESPQETMTLQRKMPDNEDDQQNYYRVSSTLPSNTNKKTS